MRAYVEKQLKAWNENQHKIRAKIFKPIQPTLERWSKSLAKKAAAEKKKTGLVGSARLSGRAGTIIRKSADWTVVRY